MGRRGRSELPAASFAAAEAFGSKVGLGLRWLPIKIEQGDGLMGGREGSWWREWRGGGSGGAGMAGAVAAAAVAGDGEGDLPGSIGCQWGS